MTDSLSRSLTTQTPNSPKPSPLAGFAKLARDPKYQALSSEAKAETRGKLFDKYVVPYYRDKGVNLDAGARDRFSKAGTGMPVEQPKAKYTDDDMYAHLLTQAAKQDVKLVRGAYQGADKVEGAVEKIMTHGGGASSIGLGAKFHEWWGREGTSAYKELDKQEDMANAYLGKDYAQPLQVRALETPLRIIGSGSADLAANPQYLGATKIAGLAAEGLLGKTAITDLLANRTTKEKLAYKSLKGAAEGYLAGAMGGENETHREASGLMFGLGEVAGAGAEGAIKFISKFNVWAGPARVEQAIKALYTVTPQHLEQADATKVTTLLMRATNKMRNEVAVNLGFKDYADARANKAQGKVATGLSTLLDQANKEAPVHNPELVAMQAQHDVKAWMSNPLGAEVAAGLKQFGVDPVQAATVTTVKNAKVSAGDFSEIKGKISKDAITTVNRLLEGLGPGAASVKEKDIFKAVTKLVETNIPMEDKAHTFTFMWGIKDSLPKEMHPVLLEGMKTLYGPKPKVWDAAAKKLDAHMDKMIASGHIKPNDPRGVFRSTKLTGLKTTWQKQLDEEVKAIRGKN